MRTVKELLEQAESVLDHARVNSQSSDHRASLARVADGYIHLAEVKMKALKDGLKDL